MLRKAYWHIFDSSCTGLEQQVFKYSSVVSMNIPLPQCCVPHAMSAVSAGKNGMQGSVFSVRSQGIME